MRAWIIFAFTTLAAFCQAQIDPFAISWSVFQSGSSSKFQSESSQIINSENDFQVFWMKLTGMRADTTPKGISWGREMLIAIMLGERPSQGYGVHVVSITRPTAATTMVRYMEQVPSRSRGQQKSNPWVLIKLTRPGGDIQVVKAGTETAPDSGHSGPPARLSWRTYQTGTDSLMDEPRGLLISNQLEFASVWKSLTGDRTPPRDVDWEDEVLILVNLGRRGSGGFDVWVEDIRPRSNGVEVRYLERKPSADQRVVRARTHPYVIVRVSRFEGNVTFQGRSWTGGG